MLALPVGETLESVAAASGVFADREDPVGLLGNGSSTAVPVGVAASPACLQPELSDNIMIAAKGKLNFQFFISPLGVSSVATGARNRQHTMGAARDGG
jgi:hypothetical protein